MMNEEYLNNHSGKARNPFRVPAGYFDSFADQMVAKLPERKTVRLRVLRRWMYAAAACLLVAMFSVTVYFQSQNRNDAHALVAVTAAQTTDESYVDEAVDYAMVDNQDIYICLASDY